MTPRGETLLEEGVVLAVMPAEGAAPARARVRLVAGDHCEGCPACAICKPDTGDRRLMDVTDPLGVAVGDHVRVAVPGGAVLKASFLVYGVPLLMLLLGVWLGSLVWPEGGGLTDLWSFLMGAALAGAAMPLVSRTVRRAEKDGQSVLTPSIAGVLGPGGGALHSLDDE
jgi:positive regulator of sigma E activity